jgi:cytochrome c-type biogenesis protein CcmH
MRRAAAAIALALAALASPALGAEPSASLPDIEDEVMCPICGTLLELSEAPQAQRQRVLIADLIAQGRTKAEIKDELVAEYGNEVLALPQGSGFQLSAYLVPALAFLLGAAAVAVSVIRWRRRPGPPGDDGGTSTAPSGADAERLDADLARYDL